VVPGKPGFTRVDLLNGTVHVIGASVPGDTPYEIHVTILQNVAGQEEPRTAGTKLDLPTSDWQATFPSDGFTKGGCVAVGHEIQLKPHFSTHTWVQYIEIK
jgi:hypothetical protein